MKQMYVTLMLAVSLVSCVFSNLKMWQANGTNNRKKEKNSYFCTLNIKKYKLHVSTPEHVMSRCNPEVGGAGCVLSQVCRQSTGNHTVVALLHV